MFTAVASGLTPAASKAAAELAVIRGGEPMMHPHGGNTNSGVLALAGSRDGKYLASSSGVYDEDMATFTAWGLKLWKPASGRLVRDFTSLDQPVRGIAFSPEGDRLAIACQDGTVRVLDVSTGHERLKLAAHAEPVRTVAWAPDGLSIASAGHDTKVCVWNAATAEKTSTFAGHAGHVLHVAFSPESKRVVSTAIGSDNTARVWDAATGHELARYRGVDDPLRASVFSHDGGSVFTVGQDPHCHVWDATNGRRWYSFKEQPHDDWIIGVALSPDGKVLATAGFDRTVRMWNAGTGRLLHISGGHGGAATCLAFWGNGQYLASGDCDGRVHLWETATGARVR